MPIQLLRQLAAIGPVSLIDPDEIECSCVFHAAQLIQAESPFGLMLQPGTLVKPMTVWGLTPAGVNLALARFHCRG